MTAIVPSQLVFYSECGHGKPYNNCMICAALVLLRWQGYDIPQGYDDAVRVATGIPDYLPSGKPRGLSYGQVLKGVTKLIPGHGIVTGGLTPAQVWQKLPRHGIPNTLKSPVWVSISDCSKLPDNLRHLVGFSYHGGHGMTLGLKVFTADPTHQGLYLDPMGRVAKGYGGQQIDLDTVFPLFDKTKDGLIHAAWVPGKDTAK